MPCFVFLLLFFVGAAQVKAQFLNLILDFFQGFASEVTDANELVFRLVDDILYRVDAGPV